MDWTTQRTGEQGAVRFGLAGVERHRRVVQLEGGRPVDWCVASGDVPDYPQIAMNGNFVTITLDVFDTSDKFFRACVIAIPRSAFEAASETCNGGSVTTKVFSGLTDPGTGEVIDPCSTEIGIPRPIQISANQNAFASVS